ncbi:MULTISPECIES: hypothetical protein [unclassified Microbacterium]|uniref:zinc finger domain-containing protein n=1 Tax=unclassified Microbacterium TaxID=2609290 RepID=UPI002469681E|nr:MULTISPECIES: hypothetical protein [unclassified Microbacterium]MDH5134615.1 hypothetical protein [Microbacterium sp. RD10]MDH5138169.1 hypothetical protein [Microbacterium sp. RD11]MDH5146111.1 hypothetical protein [Microbacterium sp. RD12]MDH5156160.1 hypothetical protein [Microbacterium sp. RD06]MDH5168096.1 hypothetical protein [Microbacterium sp. RD02]
MIAYQEREAVFLADPHGVPCSTCGVRPLEACRWRPLDRRGELVVHGRRTSAWLRRVAPQLTAQEYEPFPAVETLEALAVRRSVMRRRHCLQRRITDHLLRRFGLEAALVECVPCGADPEGERS